MNKDYFNKARSKTREEWQSLLAEKWTDLRIWVQENGELAFAVGFITGVVVVLAFKVVVALVAVAVLVGLAVWASATSEQEKSQSVPRHDPLASAQPEEEKVLKDTPASSGEKKPEDDGTGL